MTPNGNESGFLHSTVHSPLAPFGNGNGNVYG